MHHIQQASNHLKKQIQWKKKPPQGANTKMSLAFSPSSLGNMRPKFINLDQNQAGCGALYLQLKISPENVQHLPKPCGAFTHFLYQPSLSSLSAPYPQPAGAPAAWLCSTQSLKTAPGSRHFGHQSTFKILCSMCDCFFIPPALYLHCYFS